MATKKSTVKDKYGTSISDKEFAEYEGSDDPGWFVSVTTIMGVAIVVLFGHIRDLAARFFGKSRYSASLLGKAPEGMCPLLSRQETFYTRRMYHRIHDCFNRPFTGPPGAKIKVIQRKSKDNDGVNLRGDMNNPKTMECVNLGSYNYLGFADDWQSTCKKPVMSTFDTYTVGTCGARMDLGTNKWHRELETTVAKFVGKEDAFIFNMGYGTNSTVIPALMGKGSLIVSDALNHTSIVNGARASAAKIRVFKHNDAENLEQILREAIIDGQPLTHRPWTKILVMMEGIYSMEGEVGHLREIVDVCKKYKCYIYVDEAHSIGALGKTGRGICEHCGVDPSEIDILMGTFTKSFGGMGGYIASSKEFINALKRQSAGSIFSTAMSPVVCKQILTAFDIIDNQKLGREKLDQIKKNSNYFRRGLIEMGCHVLGDNDSPVIPLMLFSPSKISLFSRECYKRGLAVVVVGLPAVPLLQARARFCISAGHTREQLDDALEKLTEITKLLGLRYRRGILG